jgi:uncharacterized protein YqgQ
MKKYYFLLFVFKNIIIKIELIKNKIVYFTTFEKKNNKKTFKIQYNVEYDIYFIETENENIYDNNIFDKNKLNNCKIIDNFKYKDLYNILNNQVRTNNCIYKFNYLYIDKLKTLDTVTIIN